MKTKDLFLATATMFLMFLAGFLLAIQAIDMDNEAPPIFNPIINNSIDQSYLNYSFSIEPDHRIGNFIQNPYYNGITWDFDRKSWRTRIISAGTMEIYGSSMNPTLFDGQTIIYMDYSGNKDSLRQGQIIVYDNDGEFTIHRIWGLYPDYLMAMGDNNDIYEEVKYDQVRYIVVGVIFT